MKELEEEIGELGGLDDEMLDATGFGYRPMQSFGSFIPASLVPSALREQLEFFKETETAESALIAKLRGGKAVEKEELDNMLKAAELEVIPVLTYILQIMFLAELLCSSNNKTDLCHV